MGIIKKSIILEEKLELMFLDLPLISNYSGDLDFKHTFGSGDKKELNSFLKSAEKSYNKSPYPLIWLLYPYEEEHLKTRANFENIRLILAVNNDFKMLNKDRLETTYKKILIPLFDNIKHLLTSANIVSMEDKFTLVKHPNYSKSDLKEENSGTFIWDALSVDFTLSILPYCYKNVKF